MAKMLGWVRDRWMQELEPVLRTATTAQETQLRALWEGELHWWKTQRHLQGDSLRNPITQVRALIGELELTELNSWENPRTGKREHIGLKVCNLSEGEWVQMNDRSRATTQERLNQTQLVRDPEGIVQRGVSLLFSQDWAEVVVGIALATGRRLAELVKTGMFVVKEPYTLWFEGQVKGRTRLQERYEIPTLVRAYLVVEAVAKVRRLVDCRELEVEQVSQKYGKAVNEAVERVYAEMIPARSDRERLSVHNLRTLYASIAVLWYAPDVVSEVNYKAYIHGHRFVLSPEVAPGTSEDEVEQVRLNYASHANYDDYKLADAQGKLDGRHGIRLGQPGVTVLDFFQKEVLQVPDLVPAASTPSGKGGRRSRSKNASENKTGFSTMKPTVQTKQWVVDEQTALGQRLHREIKDDEFIRRMLVAYLGSGASVQAGERPKLSLDDLQIAQDTRDLLRQALPLSGASDLLSFLLAAGEQEARHLVSQAKRLDTTRYVSLPTSALAKIKLPEASQERFRRAVYALMQWNLTHGPLEQWYITTLAIQNLVGGNKELIKQYQEANLEDIEAHHQALHIKPSFNRKPVRIQEMVSVSEDPTAFPWGKSAENLSPETVDATVV